MNPNDSHVSSGQSPGSKDDLRHSMLARRRAMAADECEALSERMCAHLSAMVGQADTKPLVVMGYYPVRGEASPLPFLREWLAEGGCAALPSVDLVNRQLYARQIVSLEGLVTGAFDIPEPSPDAPVINPSGIGLCLIPGVAFDRQGRRLGQGYGFYDRFLALLPPHCLKVALAFQWQIVDTIQSDAWDVSVQVIVTEQGAERVAGPQHSY